MNPAAGAPAGAQQHDQMMRNIATYAGSGIYCPFVTCYFNRSSCFRSNHAARNMTQHINEIGNNDRDFILNRIRDQVSSLRYNRDIGNEGVNAIVHACSLYLLAYRHLHASSDNLPRKDPCMIFTSLLNRGLTWKIDGWMDETVILGCLLEDQNEKLRHITLTGHPPANVQATSVALVQQLRTENQQRYPGYADFVEELLSDEKFLCMRNYKLIVNQDFGSPIDLLRVTLLTHFAPANNNNLSCLKYSERGIDTMLSVFGFQTVNAAACPVRTYLSGIMFNCDLTDVRRFRNLSNLMKALLLFILFRQPYSSQENNPYPGLIRQKIRQRMELLFPIVYQLQIAYGVPVHVLWPYIHDNLF